MLRHRPTVARAGHRRRAARRARLRRGRPGPADPDRRRLHRPAARGPGRAARLAVGSATTAPAPSSTTWRRPATDLLSELGAPRRLRSRRPDERLEVLRILAGTVPPTARASRSRSTTRTARHRAPRCSTASRSCATPGPRRSRSTTRVRVVASTSFTDDGRRHHRRRRVELEPPYVIDAIGRSHTLSEAVIFPGGLHDDGRARRWHGRGRGGRRRRGRFVAHARTA